MQVLQTLLLDFVTPWHSSIQVFAEYCLQLPDEIIHQPILIIIEKDKILKGQKLKYYHLNLHHRFVFRSIISE
jgi:hypothetical protein